MIRRIAVIVPAANEEQLIGNCLDGIRAARAHLYQASLGIQVRIVVVLDS